MENMNICFVVRSCVSCLFCREILDILDLKFVFLPGILDILDLVFFVAGSWILDFCFLVGSWGFWILTK